MKNILVVGAGKSSLYLVENLLASSTGGGYRVLVADVSIDAAAQKIAGHPAGKPMQLNAEDGVARALLVQQADVVCSLLPPSLHTLLAGDCLKYRKALITASYVSDELRDMDAEAREKGLLFMGEIGLDPGIDHMSAMKIIDSIHHAGGSVTAFRSYCGGLVAPESDDNPWHYKFSWNPRNIVLAGQDGAVYLNDGSTEEIPYEHLFGNGRTVEVAGLGTLAYYPNRDSLTYPPLYGVEDAPTFLRATLRHPDFIDGWDDIVTLGLTNARRKLGTTNHTYASWTRAVAGIEADVNIEEATADKIGLEEPHNFESATMERLRSLGIFDEVPLPADLPLEASPADVLLTLLLKRWEMKPHDQDMVVMKHEIGWKDATGSDKTTISTLVLKGESKERTAMAKTVGLPMAILARMVLRGDPGLPVGVCVPTMPEVYEPVLRELEADGVIFSEVSF